MTLNKLFQTLLLIALPTTALIGGLNEKLWVVMAVVSCFTIWTLYLLIKLENRKFEIVALRSLYDAYTKLQEESERARRLPRRTDLLSRHVD